MINFNRHKAFPYFVIILGGLLFFLPFLGRVHLFDWDEINFAEIAREMIVTKDYLNVQINYQPFWEKPPLFIWMQVLSMKLFGINEFAARFPNAIGGIITLLIIYGIGKKVVSEKMGRIWVLVYAGSLLPFFYFKSGIIDPWFNLFIFLGIYFAVTYFDRLNVSMFQRLNVSEFPNSTNPPIPKSSNPPIPKSSNPQIFKSSNLPIFLSGIAIGLAILTKGPVGFLIFALTGFIFLIVTFFSSKYKIAKSSNRQIVQSSNRPIVQSLNHLLIFLAGLILTGGSWFIIQILAGNIDTVKDFIIYQVRLFNTKDAGHGGFPGYHVVILLMGVFPASAFLFNRFRGNNDETPLQKDWRRAMLILLIVVVVLFEIVKTKIVHYSSMAYFPLTYLASLAIYRVIEGNARFSRLSRALVIILALVWVSVIIGLTVAGLNKEWLIHSGLIKDQFAVANLAADVHWSGWEVLVAMVLGIGLMGFFILKKPVYKILSLFLGSMMFSFLTMTVFAEKIEGYTQRAAIDFYKDKAGEDCYLRTLGFKSYAHMFYGKTMPQQNPLYYESEWLLSGKLDKPAYFIYKNIKQKEISGWNPDLTVLYQKNGFIFAARYPEKQKTGL